MTAPHLTWKKGGSARVLSVEDDAIVLASTIPSPPGSRLEAMLIVDPPAPVRVKVHSSKKEDDATFTMRGRLIDATRELRVRLKALSGFTPAGG